MKRKRVLVAGKIELCHSGEDRWLYLEIGRSSLETWLAICTALDLGLGEVVVVPEKGLKCRLLALEKEARAELLEDQL